MSSAYLLPHDGCHADLTDALRRAGMHIDGAVPDITITTVPPLVDSPLTRTLKCPHGVTFWIEPTGDQLARWAAAERDP